METKLALARVNLLDALKQRKVLEVYILEDKMKIATLEVAYQGLDGALEDTKQKLKDLQEEYDRKLAHFTTIKKSLRAKVENLKLEVSKAKKP